MQINTVNAGTYKGIKMFTQDVDFVRGQVCINGYIDATGHNWGFVNESNCEIDMRVG